MVQRFRYFHIKRFGSKMCWIIEERGRESAESKWTWVLNFWSRKVVAILSLFVFQAIVYFDVLWSPPGFLNQGWEVTSDVRLY